MTNMIKYTVFDNSTISHSIKKINDLQSKAVIVINAKTKKVVGTLSDGDLRRAFLKGKKIKENIKGIYNKKFFYILKIPRDKKK